MRANISLDVTDLVEQADKYISTQTHRVQTVGEFQLGQVINVAGGSEGTQKTCWDEVVDEEFTPDSGR